MTDLRKAAEQALEALLRVQPQVRGAIPVQDVEAAITALKAALAAPPQQTHNEECYQWHHECAIAEVKRLRAAPPKLAREPSAWLYYDPTTKRVFASEKALLFPVMAPLYMNDEAN